MEYPEQDMNKYASYLHDLNNKLTLLYALLSRRKNENPPSEEKINAVKERINEIVKCLYTEFQFELDQSLNLTSFTCEDLIQYLSFAITKLRRIYPEVWITFENNVKDTQFSTFINFDKNLLYQAIENAVENSKNAKALLIEIMLYQKENYVCVDLRDNGEGFQEIEKIDRLLPEASGMNIIKGNMQIMGGIAEYRSNPEGGVTLSLLFPCK